MMKLQCEVAKIHHRMVFLQHRSVLGVLFVLEHICHKYVRCYTRLCDPVSQICAMLHASMRSCVTNMCDVTRVYAILCHKYVRCYTRLCDPVSQICAMLHASMRSSPYRRYLELILQRFAFHTLQTF